ncbi:MAG: AmmeMemoRadiSam system protein B [Anaerolineae bacterium]
MSAPSVRSPVCADDRWYPSDAGELQDLLSRFLGQIADPPIQGELVGLISPHAGYTFAGPTAAHAYKQLAGRRYERVILLGPNHHAGSYPGLGPQALTLRDYYQTPLGRIAIDVDAIKQLDNQTRIDFLRGDHEHSLEMQLPFLQRQLGNAFKLVPLMLSAPFYIYGRDARHACDKLAQALIPLIDSQTLLVASSDLSHLDDYRAVEQYDARLQALMGEYDIDKLVDYMVNDGECRACGDVAIITLLLAARACGANRIKVLHRTNSSDVIGQHIPGQYTVGYLAAAVYKSPE